MSSSNNGGDSGSDRSDSNGGDGNVSGNPSGDGNVGATANAPGDDAQARIDLSGVRLVLGDGWRVARDGAPDSALVGKKRVDGSGEMMFEFSSISADGLSKEMDEIGAHEDANPVDISAGGTAWSGYSLGGGTIVVGAKAPDGEHAVIVSATDVTIGETEEVLEEVLFWR